MQSVACAKSYLSTGLGASLGVHFARKHARATCAQVKVTGIIEPREFCNMDLQKSIDRVRSGEEFLIPHCHPLQEPEFLLA